MAVGGLLGSTEPAGAVATGVRGTAYGYFTHISLFGTQQPDKGPAPTVTLPPAGSSSAMTATDPSEVAQYGPAIIFQSGPTAVSTQGAPAGGSITSSTSIQALDAGPFTATSGASTCTATQAGYGASTTFAGGSLVTKTDGVGNPVTTVTIPDNPPPTSRSPGRSTT